MTESFTLSHLNKQVGRCIQDHLRYALILDIAALDIHSCRIPVFGAEFPEAWQALQIDDKVYLLQAIYGPASWISTSRGDGLDSDNVLLDGRFLIESERTTDWVEYNLIGFYHVPVKMMRLFVKEIGRAHV